jgi:hypothetical protein
LRLHVAAAAVSAAQTTEGVSHSVAIPLAVGRKPTCCISCGSGRPNKHLQLLSINVIVRVIGEQFLFLQTFLHYLSLSISLHFDASLPPLLIKMKQDMECS